MTGETGWMIYHEWTKFWCHHRHATSRHGFVAGSTRASLFTRVKHVANILCHIVPGTDKCIVANLQDVDEVDDDDNDDLPDEQDPNDCNICWTDLVLVTEAGAVSHDSCHPSWGLYPGVVVSCTPPPLWWVALGVPNCTPHPSSPPCHFVGGGFTITLCNFRS